MKFSVEMSDENFKHFQNALLYEDASANDVINDLINNYSRNVIAEHMGFNSYVSRSCARYYGKAIRRIPRWAGRTSGVPYKMIRAFLLLEKDGATTVEAMRTMCCFNDLHPEVRMSSVRSFEANFCSLQYDNGQVYGKVFDVRGHNKVLLWDEIAPTIEEYKEQFLQDL